MPGPIVVCILSRDEPVLLRENVQHLIHNENINHIIVTNHVSITTNREVLAEFGDNIVRQIDRPRALPFPQDRWRTTMARMAIQHFGASWVVLADTDEFWHGLQSLHKIDPVFESVTVLERLFEHYGTRLDPAEGYSTFNMPWHMLGRGNAGKTLHRAVNPMMLVTHKSHRPLNPGPVLRDPPEISLHHYPVRDWERFLLKVHTANEHNARIARRTAWRKMKKRGKLREHWMKEWMSTPESMNARLQAGEVAYFIPPRSA
jgi:hypothetical protein